MRPSLVFVVLTIAAVTLSCDKNGCAGTCPFADPEIDLAVTTDKSVYSLSGDQAAEPILINEGARAVYLPMNEYVFVQRFETGEWSEPQPWFVVDGFGISFALEPGDTLRSLPMGFGYIDRQVGVYRFVFEVAADSNGRERLAEWRRVSAPFEIQP